MKKNILIIHADREAAQIVKDNLTDPSTNILCASSIHEALFSFMNTDFCLVILDARISAEDDHKQLAATGCVCASWDSPTANQLPPACCLAALCAGRPLRIPQPIQIRKPTL